MRRFQEIKNQTNLLLWMEKQCKVKVYKGSRTMKFVKVWIMSINIYLYHFHVFYYIAKMFMRSYLRDKTITWYTTWRQMLSEQDASISWNGMQKALLHNFKPVNSFQTAGMRLWDLKQNWIIHEYIEKNYDLQVSIIHISGTKVLNVF